MARLLIVGMLTMVLGLTALGIAAWQTLFTLPPELFAPGASDVQIVALAPGRQTLTYRAPRSAYTWRTTVARRLIDNGWTNLDRDIPYAPQRRFMRVTNYPLFTLLEQVDLFGEPGQARIVR